MNGLFVSMNGEQFYSQAAIDFIEHQKPVQGTLSNSSWLFENRFLEEPLAVPFWELCPVLGMQLPL
jgi:hypothetical protein